MKPPFEYASRHSWQDAFQRRIVRSEEHLTTARDTSAEDMSGSPASHDTDKREPPSRLQQLEQLSRLPKAQQKLVSQVIDSVLAQANR